MVRNEPAEPGARWHHEIHRRARESVSRDARSHDIVPRARTRLVSSALVVEQERPEPAHALGRPSIIENPKIGGDGNGFAVQRRHSVNALDGYAPLVET